MVALIVVASLLQQGVAQSVSFAPRQYSYNAIAKTLSIPGQEVECDPAIRDRIAAISLRKRPVDEMRALIAKSLDLSFEAAAVGKVKMVLSKSAARSEKQRLGTYCAEYDEILREAVSVAQRYLGPESDVIRARQANDWANQVLYNLGSYSDPEILGAGLVSAFNQGNRMPATASEFFNHGSVRDLLTGPNMTCTMLTDLAGDSRFPPSVQAYQPQWQPISSLSDAEAQTQKAEYMAHAAFVSGEAFDPYYGCLTIWEGEFGRGFRGTVFRPPWQPESLNILTELKDPQVREDFANTQEFLRSTDAGIPLGKLSAPSLAVALLRWSGSTGNELIAEVSPQRDSTRFNPASTLRDLYDPRWMHQAKDGHFLELAGPHSSTLGRGQVFWMALNREGNLLLGRNLLSFLDDLRDLPASSLQGLLAAPDTDSPLPTLEDLEVVAGSLSDSQMAKVIGSDGSYFAEGLGEALPFFRLIGDLPTRQRQEINDKLRSGAGVCISLYKVPPNVRRRFANGLGAGYLMSRPDPFFRFTQFLGEERHPLFQAEQEGGIVRIMLGSGIEEGTWAFDANWTGPEGIADRAVAELPLVTATPSTTKPLDQLANGGTRVKVVWPTGFLSSGK